MTHVAIIGAGLAGLTAAKGLSKMAEVRIFVKSCRAGGRMCTRTAAKKKEKSRSRFPLVRLSNNLGLSRVNLGVQFKLGPSHIFECFRQQSQVF